MTSQAFLEPLSNLTIELNLVSTPTDYYNSIDGFITSIYYIVKPQKIPCCIFLPCHYVCHGNQMVKMCCIHASTFTF